LNDKHWRREGTMAGARRKKLQIVFVHMFARWCSYLQTWRYRTLTNVRISAANDSAARANRLGYVFGEALFPAEFPTSDGRIADSAS